MNRLNNNDYRSLNESIRRMNEQIAPPSDGRLGFTTSSQGPYRSMGGGGRGNIAMPGDDPASPGKWNPPYDAPDGYHWRWGCPDASAPCPRYFLVPDELMRSVNEQ